MDANQEECYNDVGGSITCGEQIYPEQDGYIVTNAPSYTDNGDDTITDENTGLMWAKYTVYNVTFDEMDTVAAAQVS